MNALTINSVSGGTLSSNTSNFGWQFYQIHRDTTLNILNPALVINTSLQEEVNKKIQEKEVKEIRANLAENDFLKNKLVNIKKIISFTELKENWNGYGAEKISSIVVNKALELILNEELKIQLEIFPTGRGTIQIEYEKANGDYLEVEIFEDKYVLYKEVSNINEEIEYIEVKKIIDTINEFHT